MFMPQLFQSCLIINRFSFQLQTHRSITKEAKIIITVSGINLNLVVLYVNTARISRFICSNVIQQQKVNKKQYIHVCTKL